MNTATRNNNSVKTRITQSVLVSVVEANTKALDKVDRKLNDYDERLRDLENSYVGLETKVNVWSGINSIGAIAAAGIAALFGVKQ